MPEDEYDDTETEDEQSQDTGAIRALRRRVRELEKDSKAKSAAEADAAAARRELAFVKLGIPTDEGVGKLFAKAYDGDLDPEAIRAEAESYGLLKPNTPDHSAELAAHQRLAAAQAGADGSPAFDFASELAKTRNSDEVMALAAKAGLPIKGLQ